MAWRDYIFNKFQSVIPSLVTGQSWPQVIDSTGALSINQEGRKATYRAVFNSSPGGPGPILTIQGSTKKIVRITKVQASFIASGTGAISTVYLQRFSSLTGGTSATIPIQTSDSINPSATAVALSWSVSPTTTPANSLLAAIQYEIVTASVSVLPQIAEWKFGDVPSQSIVLRGTSDFLGVSITSGAASSTATWVEWTEE